MGDDDDDTKDKSNVKETKLSNNKKSSQDKFQGEPVGELTSKASTGGTSGNIRGKAKTFRKVNSKKRKHRPDTSSENKKGDSDSDTPVQKTIPKKNHKHQILDSDHDDEDLSDGVPKRGLGKK